MIDKKDPVEPSNLDAAPVVEEDRTGPDNALKDSDAHDDAGLHDKLQSPMEQDSDAQVHDKLQSPVEQDSDARDDVGLQEKLQSPAEQDPIWMKGLTPEVIRRVQGLQLIQSRHDELKKKLYKGIQALDDTYEDSFKLLYNERFEIVNGLVDVESNTDETAEEATSDKKATKVKGIPDFWLTAMENNKSLAPMITRRDKKALKYLKDIKCYTIGDPLELKLVFFFGTNPFFKNSTLTKTYKENKKYEEITDAPSTGSKINWFPKKSLTHEITKHKQIEGRPKKRNTITDTFDSFFNFFEDPQDDGIGRILQNKIIPNAVSWYTGEASDNDSEFEEDSDETESSEQEDEYGLSWYTRREPLQEDLDETESSKQDDEFDGYEDENKGDGEASKKRTRVECLTLKKSRRIQHESRVSHTEEVQADPECGNAHESRGSHTEEVQADPGSHSEEV